MRRSFFKCSQLLSIITISLLSSCCSTIDSRVAKGYPYGDWQELEFTIADPKSYCGGSHGYYNDFNSIFSRNNIEVVRNRLACDTLIRQMDSSCDCHNFNFDRNILVCFNGFIRDTREIMKLEYSPRAIINHAEQTLKVEFRGYEKACSGGSAGSPSYHRQLLLIPKPPDHYKVEVTYFAPVEHLTF